MRDPVNDVGADMTAEPPDPVQNDPVNDDDHDVHAEVASQALAVSLPSHVVLTVSRQQPILDSQSVPVSE